MNFSLSASLVGGLLLFIGTATSAFSLVEEPDPVTFSRKDGNAKPLRSEIIFLDKDGLGVVVTEVTANVTSGKYRGRPVELVAHDPVSRLSLVKATLEEGRQLLPVELGTSLDLKSGDSLYRRVETESAPSRIVARATQHNEKPLPLELFRVHHPTEVKPLLGHPFFDSAGRLVGINYRMALEFGNGSFVFPVEAIKRLLNATVTNGVVQRSWFGVELLASDPFAVVQGIRASSPAARGGLLRGDILLQIGPRPIRNYADAINAFYYLREGESDSVRYLRGTEILTVEVVPELVPAPLDLTPKKESLPLLGPVLGQ